MDLRAFVGFRELDCFLLGKRVTPGEGGRSIFYTLVYSAMRHFTRAYTPQSPGVYRRRPCILFIALGKTTIMVSKFFIKKLVTLY